MIEASREHLGWVLHESGPKYSHLCGTDASGSGADPTISWNPNTKTLTLGKRQTGSVNSFVGNGTPSYTADSTLVTGRFPPWSQPRMPRRDEFAALLHHSGP
jgi:hypothetical protein